MAKRGLMLQKSQYGMEYYQKTLPQALHFAVIPKDYAVPCQDLSEEDDWRFVAENANTFIYTCIDKRQKPPFINTESYHQVFLHFACLFALPVVLYLLGENFGLHPDISIMAVVKPLYLGVSSLVLLGLVWSFLLELYELHILKKYHRFLTYHKLRFYLGLMATVVANLSQLLLIFLLGY